MTFNVKIIRVFLISFLFVFSSQSVGSVDLSVMVLYNKEFKESNTASVAVHNYIETTNRAFKDSGMSTRLDLVHHQEVNIGRNAKVGEWLLSNVASSQKVWELEDSHRPDVTLYLARRDPGVLCGKGIFPKKVSPRFPSSISNSTTKFRSYAVVGWDGYCGEQTFIHEVGHVLGAGHGSVRQRWEIVDGLIHGTDRFHPGIPIEESVGHGVYNVFRTVMTYPDVYGDAPVQLLVSNPAKKFNGSIPTGTTSKNAAAGMDSVARGLVRFNSACYPAKWVKDRYGRYIKRECNEIDHCVRTKTSGGRRPSVTCLEYDPD